MSKWIFGIVGLALLAGLFALARQGDPLAIAVLAVLGTLAIMTVTFAGVWLLQSREERRFRANAEENAGLLQAQAKAQAAFSLAQQRQLASLPAAPARPVGEPPGYSFGFAPDAWAGFGDESEVIEIEAGER
jgi:hypothetical protein